MEKRKDFLEGLKVYLEEDIEEDYQLPSQLPKSATKGKSTFSLEDFTPHLEEDIEK